MKQALFSALIGCVSLVGLLGVFLGYAILTMPDARLLKKPCFTGNMNHVQICKSDGNYAPLAEISENVRNAVIISEDAAFYAHKGIDTDELRESLKKDFAQGRFARGASTITQQLAKNVFFTKGKTISRKLREIYMAFQIEKALNKSQILEAYLNVVEFGPDIYGIKPAAQFYFRKSPAQLSAQEAAFLAFLLPNPKKYSQSFFKRELTPFARQMLSRILHKLEVSHRISDAEYQVALSSLDYFPWNVTGPISTPEPTGIHPESEEDSSDDEFQFDLKADDAP